jgi:hypothetical protein
VNILDGMGGGGKVPSGNQKYSVNHSLWQCIMQWSCIGHSQITIESPKFRPLLAQGLVGKKIVSVFLVPYMVIPQMTC